MEACKLHQEDIDGLVLRIHDWLQVTPLADTEEGFDWLHELVNQYLDKFNNGYRNYN